MEGAGGRRDMRVTRTRARLHHDAPKKMTYALPFQTCSAKKCETLQAQRGIAAIGVKPRLKWSSVSESDVGHSRAVTVRVKGACSHGVGSHVTAGFASDWPP